MTYDGPNIVKFIVNQPVFPGSPVVAWGVVLVNEGNKTVVAAVGDLG